MPHIEVLPNSTKGATTPGWAYVLDTGLDPSKQAILPSGSRKRARISNYASDTPLATSDPAHANSREQTRINKHLAELDKENHRDVQIVPPDKPKDVAHRGLRKGQMTPGVRRIMLSQKTWVNYLADEEAEISSKGHIQPQAPVPNKPEVSTSQSPASGMKRKVGRPSTKKHSMTGAVAVGEPMNLDLPTSSTSHEDQNASAAKTPAVEASPLSLPSDIEYLTAIHTPTLPSPAEIEGLLSQPPLSYSAARAAPSTSTAPPRKFCEICGYWGRVQCMKCRARICSLECKAAHDETRCAKFFA